MNLSHPSLRFLPPSVLDRWSGVIAKSTEAEPASSLAQTVLGEAPCETQHVDVAIGQGCQTRRKRGAPGAVVLDCEEAPERSNAGWRRVRTPHRHVSLEEELVRLLWSTLR
jgi:hypothetical protein